MVEVALFLDQFEKVNQIDFESGEKESKDETLYKIDP